MLNKDNWEHKFWELVEEKGIGSDIQFILLLRDFIRSHLKSQRKELNVGFLRQWLNEDRITNPDKMVTDAQIKHMLGLLDIEVKKEYSCPCPCHKYGKNVICVNCDLS